MKGLPPVWMHYPDELYGMLRGPGKTIQKLGERLISLRGVKHGRFIPGTVGARI